LNFEHEEDKARFEAQLAALSRELELRQSGAQTEVNSEVQALQQQLLQQQTLLKHEKDDRLYSESALKKYECQKNNTSYTCLYAG
jgi:hypothetical protein